MSPSAGPVLGGTTVTVTGSGFAGATAVDFGSTPATFEVNTSSSITATAPSGSAGTVNLTVTTAGGTSATGASDVFTYEAVPTVTGLSPSAGPTAGGNSVTVSGTGFTGATAVDFGSTAAGEFTWSTRRPRSPPRRRPRAPAPSTHCDHPRRYLGHRRRDDFTYERRPDGLRSEPGGRPDFRRHLGHRSPAPT